MDWREIIAILVIGLVLVLSWFGHHPLASLREPPPRQVPEPLPPSHRPGSKGEELACQAYEDLLGYAVLHNHRPDFLRNPRTGAKLELDCYDPISETAVEYNGRQHYEWPNPFHRTLQAFEDQLWRDRVKLEICDARGLYLIRVPYTVDAGCQRDERYQRLYAYIEERLSLLDD